MVKTQKRIRNTAVKLSIAAVALASLGAAVIAAPSVVTRAHLASVALESLGTGPAIQLAKAGPGEREDCVRVTSVTGPDGKQYPTFGMVCGGE